MSVFEKFINREKELPVESVRINGTQIWPYLRVYIGSLVVFAKDRRVAVSGQSLGLVRYLFYGFTNWFGKYDNIVFTSSNQRRLIDGKYTDRCDMLPGKNLVVEQPVGKHFKRRKTASEYLVSKMRFYLAEKLLQPFIRVGKIENEDVIKTFIDQSEINFDYRGRIKTFGAQYRIYKRFLKWKKPKKLYVVNSYINMAIVKAAHDLDIEVIEFQHGVLNKTHYAYNLVKSFDRAYYPDKLLTFGHQEKNTFDSQNFFIEPDKVYPVGSFIIDHVNRNFEPDEKLQDLSAKYSLSVAITSQDAYEEFIVPFVKEMAGLAQDILFVFIPRTGGEEKYDFGKYPNVVFVPWLNTYEAIKNCDFHTTLTSTCAIEAPSLGIPNVLMDIDSKAKAYYGETLTERNYTFYGDTPQNCIDLLRSVKRSESETIMESNSDMIITNYKENIRSWKS